MKTTMKVAGVLAVVVGASFLLADKAEAGCKTRGWGYRSYGYHHVKPYYFIRPCHSHHYGYCKYYRRYGFCRYYVPGPVGGPPVVGTLPAPGPQGAAVGGVGQQAASTANQNGAVAANGQSNNNNTSADSSPQIDSDQIAAIVAAVQTAMEKPNEREQPNIDPEILRALDQLVAQKVAETTRNSQPPLPVIEQTAQESQSNSSDMEALREMLAQLLAQQQTRK